MDKTLIEAIEAVIQGKALVTFDGEYWTTLTKRTDGITLLRTHYLGKEAADEVFIPLEGWRVDE